MSQAARIATTVALAILATVVALAISFIELAVGL